MSRDEGAILSTLLYWAACFAATQWTGRAAGSPRPGAGCTEVMNRSSQGRKFPAQELPTSLFTGNAEHKGGAVVGGVEGGETR